jgi:glycosyltransferase involved in cell wall biosynthesis
MRIVALLTVRNEGLYMEKCLEHLSSQGIETCVVDNESTDDSVAITKTFLGRGVFRIERQPYGGFF